MTDMQTLKRHLVPVGTLLVISVLTGLGAVTIPLLTVRPELALPSALSLPLMIPPLAFSPLGLTSSAYWLADLVGVAVMVLVVWAQTAASTRKHPLRGRARAFFSGVWATVLGVVAGNTLRFVFVAVVTQTGPLSFLGLFAVNLVFSAITGLAVGLVVGVVSALLHPRARAGVPAGPDPVPAEQALVA